MMPTRGAPISVDSRSTSRFGPRLTTGSPTAGDLGELCKAFARSQGRLHVDRQAAALRKDVRGIKAPVGSHGTIVVAAVCRILRTRVDSGMAISWMAPRHDQVDLATGLRHING